MAAADTSRSGGSADSYIGSLISLTSKSEIRYEGILFNINTEESSIGLRNVRSFGTEGRKKDGPQIPPSDKIYEYILFRGSDIKDLQVKSSPPPVQPAPSIHNDPAIIQSHYPRPTSTSTSMPSIGSGPIPDLSGHPGQVAMPRTTFQGGLPLYQPGGSLGSWGSSPAPPTANGSGLGMPMYWQGFYAPSGGLPHLQQPPLLRPPPGLQVPQSMQQPLQYPGINPSMPSLSNLTMTNASLPSASLTLPGAHTSLSAVSSSLPEIPSLLPTISTTASLSSAAVPTVVPSQTNLLAAEIPQSLLANRNPVTSLQITTSAASLPLVPPPVSKPESFSEPISSMPRDIHGPNLPYQSNMQPAPTKIGLPSAGQGELVTPTLVTPGQLLQSGPSTVASSKPLQTAHKEAEVKPAARELPKEDPAESKVAVNDPKEPILPTPPDRKANGASHTHANHNSHQNYRGRGRGRGNGYSRPVTKFTEDFDFTAMNEKFKKDEVWGHLGKTKGQALEREGDANEYDDDGIQEEDGAESSKSETKPVYVKDDFFDSLSCNALDRRSGNGRTKFSEQLKIDTETFGDFPRHRPGRGGGRGFRGGGRARGSFYGRGYGFGSRGRGYAAQNRAS